LVSDKHHNFCNTTRDNTGNIVYLYERLHPGALSGVQPVELQQFAILLLLSYTFQ